MSLTNYQKQEVPKVDFYGSTINEDSEIYITEDGPIIKENLDNYIGLIYSVMTYAELVDYIEFLNTANDIVNKMKEQQDKRGDSWER